MKSRILVLLSVCGLCLLSQDSFKPISERATIDAIVELAEKDRDKLSLAVLEKHIQDTTGVDASFIRKDKVLHQFVKRKIAQLRELKKEKGPPIETDRKLMKLLRKTFGKDVEVRDVIMYAYMGELADDYLRAKQYQRQYEVRAAMRQKFNFTDTQYVMMTDDLVRIRISQKMLDAAVQEMLGHYNQRRGEIHPVGYDRVLLARIGFDWVRKSKPTEEENIRCFWSNRARVFFSHRNLTLLNVKSMVAVLAAQDPKMLDFAGVPREDVPIKWKTRVADAWTRMPLPTLPREEVAAIEQTIKELPEDAHIQKTRLLALLGRWQSAIAVLVKDKKILNKSEWLFLRELLICASGSPAAFDPQSAIFAETLTDQDVRDKVAELLQRQDPNQRTKHRWDQYFVRILHLLREDDFDRIQNANPGEVDWQELLNVVRNFIGDDRFYNAYCRLHQLCIGRLGTLEASAKLNIKQLPQIAERSEKKKAAITVEINKIAAEMEEVRKTQEALQNLAAEDADSRLQLETVRLFLSTRAQIAGGDHASIKETLEANLKKHPESFRNLPIYKNQTMGDLLWVCRMKLFAREFGDLPPERQQEIKQFYVAYVTQNPQKNLRNFLKEAGFALADLNAVSQVQTLLSKVLDPRETLYLKMKRIQMLHDSGKELEALREIADMAKSKLPVSDYATQIAQIKASGQLRLKINTFRADKPQLTKAGPALDTLLNDCTPLLETAQLPVRHLYRLLRESGKEESAAAWNACVARAFLASNTMKEAFLKKKPLREDLLADLASIKIASTESADDLLALLCKRAMEVGSPENRRLAGVAMAIASQLQPDGPPPAQQLLTWCAGQDNKDWAPTMRQVCIAHFYEQNKHDDALALIAAAEKAGESSDQMLLAKSLCNLRLGKTDDSEQALKTLLAEYPKTEHSARARFLLAWICVLQDRKDEAKKLLQLVIAEHQGTKFAKKADDLLQSLSATR